MDIGVFTRTNDIENICAFFDEIERRYGDYSFQELSSFGNYFNDFIRKENLDFKNQTKAINFIEKVNKVRLFYKYLANKTDNRDFFNINIELGNFIENLQKKYL